ncbi:MAG: aminopeptidase P family protein [Chloroflexi bacterium]|nr:aminopeptidase P family protein [Chloroflexota bacterium]
MTHARLLDLNERTAAAGLDCVAILPGPNLVYLTGLHFHLSERPIVVFFPVSNTPAIILPEFEAGKVSDAPYPMTAFTYGEDDRARLDAFQQAIAHLELVDSLVGVEGRRMRVMELRLIERFASNTRFELAEDVMASLRMTKDADELRLMRHAADIAERALAATLPQVRIGMTEKGVSAILTAELLRAGTDLPIPFEPIIGSGPNSASPHHFVSERNLRPGDLLVVDWGAAASGYLSDLTRTFAIGEIDAEFKKIHETVKAANEAGIAACGPGVEAQAIDRAARAVIEKAGYGEYFTHRTGHGLGLEGHEEPYIREGNADRLDPGMTFTVEPGIYLPGRGGVRIEDNVVIAESGAETLSSFSKELRIIG